MSRFKGKKVLIVGFGRSGVSVAKYMCKQGARVVVTDIKQKTELSDSVAACMDLKIDYDLGRHNTRYFESADLIVVSPGVPLSIRPLEEARERGVPITNEVDLAAQAIKEPIVAVTGTNGKTTSSLILGEMFRADGRTCFVGGNIGKPLLDYVNEEMKADIVVAELSSFQLELVEKLVPAVALFTNLDQDHLDRYPDMEAYANAKKRLLKLVDRNSFVVLNHDDPIVSRFAEECPGKAMWFCKKDPMQVGQEFAEQFVGAYYIPGDRQFTVRFNGKSETYDTSRLRLFGDHNKDNLMAASCAARVLGVKQKAIQDTIDKFQGVPHRLEFVRKKDGVFFINDSKATNVMSVYRSITAFRKNPIILIAGGKDKDMDFGPLSDLVRKRCKILILIGEAKEKLNRSLGDAVETYLMGTFEEGVLMAYQKSRTGDIILLSPGCASHDMFRNYEERGDYFKKLVTQL